MKPRYKTKHLSLNPRNKPKDDPNTVKRHLYDEPLWKKTLKGKLLHLLKNNILLCESKFNPLSFTESIAPKIAKQNVNKFKPLDNRIKVNIFTNTNPQVLQPGLHFYTRYFDFFQSPDELLVKHFTEEEIFAIKTDPFYFKFNTTDFCGVSFFKKKTLTDTLNEEEKFGVKQVVKQELRDSLKKTKKKIAGYLDYYTYVMSQKDLIQDRRAVKERNQKTKMHTQGNEEDDD